MHLMGTSFRAEVSAAPVADHLRRGGGATNDGASPDPAFDAVVTTQSLRKVYANGRVAVEDLDLRVGRGEIFGLLGPNGAGKSTTVGMLTTRIIPTSGTAIVNGIDIAARPAQAKQVLGVVSQANTLDQGLNVWENLYFHGRYFGLGDKPARAVSDELLERFRLGDRKTAEVGSLSGGMARRLMVARALLHRPAVIFLDEPTAALDPQSRIALWEILIELQGEGQTVLVTTHRMEEADEHCDRLAIMDHGRILAVGTPRQLKSSLGSGAAVTVRAENRLEDLAAYLGRASAVTEIRVVDEEVRFSLPTTAGALQWVLAAAQVGGYQLTDLSVTDDTLETVFVSLTGKELRE
jgi:ABC-2 type transport system ATP-binding protein